MNSEVRQRFRVGERSYRRPPLCISLPLGADRLGIHPHPSPRIGVQGRLSPTNGRGGCIDEKAVPRCLSSRAVMDFRFLAPLGMTGRPGWIIVSIPFCLPLSALWRRDCIFFVAALLRMTAREQFVQISRALNSYGGSSKKTDIFGHLTTIALLL